MTVLLVAVSNTNVFSQDMETKKTVTPQEVVGNVHKAAKLLKTKGKEGLEMLRDPQYELNTGDAYIFIIDVEESLVVSNPRFPERNGGNISYMLDANNVEAMSKLYIMMAMLTLIGWAGVARMVRGQILYLREQEYMMAAEATGLSLWRKLFKHLLPNVLPQLIVSMTLGLGGIILTEATLGYLGLGVPAEYATWGNMINVLTSEVSYWGQYPNQWVPVGICIVLAVLAFNFTGEGLRKALFPR